MESNFNNRDFEQLIKKNADQYRMIPSDKVWQGINTALHSRRRWYGIGLVALLLMTAVAVTWVMSTYPVSEKAAVPTALLPKPIIPIQPAGAEQPDQVTSTTEINQLLAKNKFTRENHTVTNRANETGAAVPGNATGNEASETVVSRDALIVSVERPNTAIHSSSPATIEAIVRDENAIPSGELNFNLLPKKLLATGSQPTAGLVRQDKVSYPLTIESVVNSYKPARVRKRISWQLYFAPTISYRKLSANKSYKHPSAFADPITYPFTSLTDVNKAVTHKPDMGLELGFATRYPLTKNLKLRGGLQFNINRYDIKAFVYNGEQATINLNGGDGTNSVTAWTNYRNYNGYKSDWLKNFYFSVSAPIGAEVTLFGNQKTSFGVAGTIQPTYILSDRAYLISTDYKNYAKVPWLIRNLNVNTSFETFINYTSRNNTRWQVGPQVRYQVLSSFQNKYPVRENLFDFGLKVGVTLNQ